MAPTKQGRRRGGHGPVAQKTGSGGIGSSERAHLGSRATPSQIRLNRNICAAADRGNSSAVLSFLQSHRADMSLVNLSTTWHCLARVSADKGGHLDSGHLAMLQEQTRLELLRHCNALGTEEPHSRCVSTIAWSCARLQLGNALLLSAVSAAALRWLQFFKPFELANVLWGFAKLQLEDEPLFRTAHNHILEHASQFSVRSLSMAAWAFATVRFRPCRGLMCKMADVFAADLQKDGAANAVTLTNMSWALATARVHVKKEALLIIGDAAVSALKGFNAHELSITLWAFARLNCGHDGLFSLAAQLLCTSPHLRMDIHSQGLANLLWAFARHAQACHPNSCWHVSSKILRELLPTFLRLLPEMRPLELASTVWAVATLAISWGQDPAADQLLEAVGKFLLFQPGLLDRLSPHCLNGVLDAYCGFFNNNNNNKCAPPPVCTQLVTRLSVMGATQQQVFPDLHHSLGGDQTLDPEESCFDASDGNCMFAGEQPVVHSPALAPSTQHVPEKHRWAPNNDSSDGAERRTGQLSRNQPIAATLLEPEHVILEREAQHGAYLDERMLECQRLVRDLEQPAQEPPWISIVQEFSYYGNHVQQGLDGLPIEIAFEVSSHDRVKVTAEVLRDESKVVQWLEFDIDPEDSLQKLCLPPLEGHWTVQLCLRSKTGSPVGTPVRMSFLGCSPELWTVPSEAYGPPALSDATSTCAHTDAGLCFSTTSSNLDAAEQDVRAKTCEGLYSKNEVTLETARCRDSSLMLAECAVLPQHTRLHWD